MEEKLETTLDEKPEDLSRRGFLGILGGVSVLVAGGLAFVENAAAYGVKEATQMAIPQAPFSGVTISS